MYDLLIRQALIFNGLDLPPLLGDVAIKAGVIAKIAPTIDEPALKIQDAMGLWLTPGFIDIHTHYDIEVEISPGLPESVRHGVTSIVMGNCSLSVTVGDPKTLADIFLRVETLPAELVHHWLSQAVQWQTPAAYFTHLEQLNLGPNVAAMLGHSALRAKVMGLERSLSERATKAELIAMQNLAIAALDAGCIGISIDMVHWHKVSGAFSGAALPSHHAHYEEYKMLTSVCRERDAVFQMIPNPGNLFSFVNIFRLSSGVFRPPLRNTILSALDMSEYPALWRLFPVMTFICNRLLNGNIRFQTLTEPFTIYADGPLTPLFEEFATGVLLNSCSSREERRQLWADKKFELEFKKQWCSKLPRTFHRDLAQMTILKSPDHTMVGKTFAEVAATKNKEALALFYELLVEYDDQIRWMACGANHRPAIRQRLMAHPHILPGFSDAGAHSRHLAFFDSSLSLIRQAVSTQFISPQLAIKRVTSEPAAWFKLKTGVLREGAKADIVLLRPEKLRMPIPAPTEIKDPLLQGAIRLVKRDVDPAIASVYIAGKEVVCDGQPLPILGQEKTGTVLKSQYSMQTAAANLSRYRNRINDELWDHPFTQYWDIFLLKHQHKWNAIYHCWAVVVMYALFILAVYTRHFYWLLFMPISQLIGLIGHRLFERSAIDVRDTIFSWRAFLCLHRLFYAVISRQYSPEISRVRQALSDYEKVKQ
ncbi:MAG: amidohydrolase family protein [Gammaproteobacteria bacterium]|nr:amidohydrolase family protein [Gammaproteobacteria bacterium]